MRSVAPALFPIFRSQSQAEILAALLLHPEREQTITELSRRLHIPLATVSDEVARFVEAELLTTRRVGRANLLTPNPTHKLIAPLTEIALSTMGPHLVVREAFAEVSGVNEVLIYGSWAARYHGRTGPPPRDLDLLVVGKPDRDDVYTAAVAVEQLIGLPVNPVVASPSRWHDDADPLMADIKAKPTVVVERDAG